MVYLNFHERISLERLRLTINKVSIRAVVLEAEN
jgi:hypothetical protein